MFLVNIFTSYSPKLIKFEKLLTWWYAQTKGLKFKKKKNIGQVMKKKLWQSYWCPYRKCPKKHQKPLNGTISIQSAIPLKTQQFNFSSTSSLLQSIKTNSTYFSLNPRVVLRVDLDYPFQVVIRAFFIIIQTLFWPSEPKSLI